MALALWLSMVGLCFAGALAQDREVVAVLGNDGVGNCERLRVAECTQIGYNFSRTRNIFNQTQDEAYREFQSFIPLFRTNCSNALLPFICLAYFSPCSDNQKALPPCRNLCVIPEKPCGDHLRRLGLDWPKKIQCKEYPTQGLGMCCTNTRYRQF